MLRFIIELDFFGLGVKKKILHELFIINNIKCKNRPEYGNYDIIIDNIKYENILQNFKRKKGALKLFQEILNNLDSIPNQVYQK